MKVITQAQHFSADYKLAEYLKQKLSKLEHFFDRIIEANVFLKLENSGQVRDKISEINIKIPGTTLVAKEVGKTFESSIDKAVFRLKRQLLKHKEKSKARIASLK